MNFITYRQIIYTLTVCVVVAFPISLFAETGDSQPPEIQWHNPVHGQLGVSVNTTIKAFICDPLKKDSQIASGIDPNSIILTLNGDPVVFYADDMGNNVFYVHSNLSDPLDYTSWYTAKIVAKDFAGNILENGSWIFQTEYPEDTVPPLIFGLSPQNNSTNIPIMAEVSAKIRDTMSGIDSESIGLKINGKLVNHVIYDLLPSGFMVSYQHIQPFDYNRTYFAEINVKDRSGNNAYLSWHFNTENEPPTPVELLYPSNGALLNYQLEDGNLHFEWSYENGDQFYRLITIIPSCGAFDSIDMNPRNYIIINHRVNFNVLLDEGSWKNLSQMGDILWQVVKIDDMGGDPINPVSESSCFSLAPIDAVVLRAPFNECEFWMKSQPPVFRWDHFAGAESYYLGIARMAPGEGSLIEQVALKEIDSSNNFCLIRPSEWNRWKEGQYIWAVIAELEDGSRSDFMNYVFRKNNSPSTIINFDDETYSINEILH